jgi:integrase
VALKLYRRHRKECEGKHSEDAVSGEFEEGRRGWKKCACLIHFSGTLGGKYSRRQTGKSQWEEAKAVVQAFEATGAWDAKPPVPAPASEPTDSRMSIADAVTVFISLREGEKIAGATLRKHKTFVKQLTEFTDSRGYVMLDQITRSDMDRFYAGMKLGLRSKAKRLSALRGFFRFCVNREWIVKSPVSSDLKPPIGSSRIANKIPFTDEELERIVNACDMLGEVKWSNRRREGVWTGEDAKDFIWTLVYTGLRISDVALFSIERLQGNEVFLRAKKNGGDVFAYLPDWLRDRLIARSKKYGAELFRIGESDRLDTMTDIWRRKLNKAFELAGKFDFVPTPHRFRHTFARILLQRGVPVADVADLLGDDEETIRTHYSRWVPARQARLTKILQEAFEDKPKPKIVAIR